MKTIWLEACLYSLAVIMGLLVLIGAVNTTMVAVVDGPRTTHVYLANDCKDIFVGKTNQLAYTCSHPVNPDDVNAGR